MTILLIWILLQGLTQLFLSKVTIITAFFIFFGGRIVLARQCVAILQERQKEFVIRKFEDDVRKKIVSIMESSLDVSSQTYSKRREKLWVLFYDFIGHVNSIAGGRPW